MLMFMMRRENIVMGLLLLGSIALIISGILGFIIKKNSEVEAYPNIVQSQTNSKNLLIVTEHEPEETSVQEIPDELIPEKVPYNPKNPDITIDFYKTFLEKHPNYPDTPAVLTAIGNLYMNKKMDYRTAASYFERVIIEYPKWDGIKSVYTLLSMCYEELNDHQGKIWLYQKILEEFPPDSQEYQFAKEQLGLK